MAADGGARCRAASATRPHQPERVSHDCIVGNVESSIPRLFLWFSWKTAESRLPAACACVPASVRACVRARVTPRSRGSTGEFPASQSGTRPARSASCRMRNARTRAAGSCTSGNAGPVGVERVQVSAGTGASRTDVRPLTDARTRGLPQKLAGTWTTTKTACCGVSVRRHFGRDEDDGNATRTRAAWNTSLVIRNRFGRWHALTSHGHERENGANQTKALSNNEDEGRGGVGACWISWTWMWLGRGGGWKFPAARSLSLLASHRPMALPSLAAVPSRPTTPATQRRLATPHPPAHASCSKVSEAGRDGLRTRDFAGTPRAALHRAAAAAA